MKQRRRNKLSCDRESEAMLNEPMKMTGQNYSFKLIKNVKNHCKLVLFLLDDLGPGNGVDADDQLLVGVRTTIRSGDANKAFRSSKVETTFCR